MLQALEQGALELLLLLPGQLLGDHAAVAQAGPQPAGARRREAALSREPGTRTAPLPGRALPFPKCVPWKPRLTPTPGG